MSVKPDAWYRCSRSGSGLCYWDGPQSALGGINHDRCPVCGTLAVEVRYQEPAEARALSHYQRQQELAEAERAFIAKIEDPHGELS